MIEYIKYNVIVRNEQEDRRYKNLLLHCEPFVDQFEKKLYEKIENLYGNEVCNVIRSKNIIRSIMEKSLHSFYTRMETNCKKDLENFWKLHINKKDKTAVIHCDEFFQGPHGTPDVHKVLFSIRIDMKEELELVKEIRSQLNS